jgi:hypothetical protein
MINKDTKKISNQRNFSSFDFDEKKMKMKIIFGTTMFICSLMLFVIYVAALLPSDPSTIYTTDLT